jgi:regulator of PEP synthase PpsR (kinase-PPPase family)
MDPQPLPRPAIYFNVHLVSDSTGETLSGIMRATTAQFDNVAPLEHAYYLVRSPKQMDRVLREIESAPGVVLYTISDTFLRAALEQRCRDLGCPHLAVLDPTLDLLVRYLGLEASHRVGGQHSLDADYFKRIDAVTYSMAHDDGQAADHLDDADVVLIGVSRTSKTPTCMYLAHRGVRAANVPLVLNIPPPEAVYSLRHPLVVGLKISPERLMEIRRNRLRSIGESPDGEYADEDRIRDEILNSQRIFARIGCPTIDVTRRSVEETAAQILNLLAERRRP